MKSFILKLSLKDGIRQKVSLSILSSCCILATAALLAILSLKANISSAIEENSKSLLGADFVISSRHAPLPETEVFLSEIEKHTNSKPLLSKEIAFASMALFKESMRSRLVQISAISAPFPLYGTLKIEPPESTFLESENRHALVDLSLKSQFNLSTGQTIQLGNTEFIISGFIAQLPGGTEAGATLAPRILIPLSQLESTNLIQKGSIVRYKYLYKLPVHTPISRVKNQLQEKITALNLSLETYEDRAESLERNISIVYRFFDSSTILSFLLGGIGIWSGALVYLRKKRNFLETLYLLGLNRKQILTILGFQIFTFGAVSTIIGCGLGILVQYILPKIISNFTPVEIPFFISWSSLLLTVTSSIWILLISSYLAFYTLQQRSHTNRHKFLIPVLLLAGTTLLWLLLITGSVLTSIIYTGFSIIFFGILFGISYVLRKLARKVSSHLLHFPLSQGIKNLYRPYNQTLTLLISIGIVSFSALFILITQSSAIKKLELLETEGISNLLLFDIQDDQVEELFSFLKEHKLPAVSHVPVITMRMTEVKGNRIEEIRKKNEIEKKIPTWVLTREYRSSYKPQLDESEIVTEGNYIGRWDTSETNPIPISVEKGIVDKLELSLGDKIRFSVQGVEIETFVSSIRKVNWQQFKPNFFILFPEGALEGAPQTSIISTRYDSQEQNAIFQNELVQKFGNISAIDLELVIATARSISSQLKNTVLFLSLIIISSALVILSGIIWASRASRTEESVLLRTLGAQRNTLISMLFYEYFALGVLGSFAGAIIAFGAGAVFSTYFLETPLFIPFIPSFLTFLTIILVVIILGSLGAIGTLRKGTIESYRALE